MACSSPSCDDYDKPGSRWDYALMGAAAAAALPFIAANMVILIHRKRPYFRAQGGAPLLLISSASGLIWIVATFVINLHFPRRHGLLCCPLWSFWLQLALGFCPWLTSQIVRLLHLHRLCQQTSASKYLTKRWILLYALLMWIPSVVFSAIAHCLHASVVDESCPKCANCKLKSRWGFCTYIILPLMYFTILGILLYCCRNTEDYMLEIEYSHASEYSFAMAIVIYILFGATVLIHGQKKIPGRCFLTFCICFLVFVNFWVRLGWPVYLCLFKKKTEMDKFEEELRSSGAQCLNGLSSRPETTRRNSSSLEYNAWVMRSIVATTTEALECEERVNQLLQRKHFLSEKIKQLNRPETHS